MGRRGRGIRRDERKGVDSYCESPGGEGFSDGESVLESSMQRDRTMTECETVKGHGYAPSTNYKVLVITV